MNSYAYYNGNFGLREEIKIPLYDRAIFFGDAVYDAAIGSYDRILWEEEHIDRFFENAKRIGIKHRYTKRFLSELLHEIGVKSMLKSYFIYFQISRCKEKRAHSAKATSSALLITVDPIEILPDPAPLRLITAEDKRYGFCDIKTVNLLPAVLASTEAEARGCDEAIFVRDGIVTECAKSNISIIKQGRVITHHKSNRILPGVTRTHLLKLCEEENIPVEERPFSVEEMFSADEILVTGTGKLCKRAEEINGIRVGGKGSSFAGLLCSKMYKEYAEFCKI